MGCAASSQDPGAGEADLKNTEIDKQIKQEKKQLEKRQQVKLLILGPGESGKSTVIKQMSLIYGSGFSPDQVAKFRLACQMNVLASMRALIIAMDTLKIPYEFKLPTDAAETARRLLELPPVPLPQEEFVEASMMSLKPGKKSGMQSGLMKGIPEDAPSGHTSGHTSKADVVEEGRCMVFPDLVCDLAAREYTAAGDTFIQQNRIAEMARKIVELDDPEFGFNPSQSITLETVELIKELWKDSGIQYCYSRANEYQLPDCCSYVMEHIDRICVYDFTPTNEDVLQSRTMTVGVHEYRFTVEGISFLIYDVGGQRSERKKWAQFFDDTQSIIYVIAVSSYDQTCFEDEETNRVVESMNLFASVCNHPLFKKVDMVLFLNKIDLFQEKIKKRPISMYFHDYTGENTVSESAAYFAKRFIKMNKYPNDKKIYPHLTHATDTRQAKKIFKSVFDSILQWNLQANMLT